MQNNSEYDNENIHTIEYSEYILQKQNKFIQWSRNLLYIVKNVVYYPITIIKTQTDDYLEDGFNIV